jgi:cell division protease FtsH
VLTERMDELHRISKILLERETIDRAQFLRLLDGASEEDVWPPVAEEPEEPAERRVPESKPRGLGLPLPSRPPETPPAQA